MEEIQSFEKILFTTYPELEKLVDGELIKLYDYVNDSNIGYQYTIGFPSEYRDKIYTLLNFCGIEIAHEHGTWSDRTIFETEEIFY